MGMLSLHASVFLLQDGVVAQLFYSRLWGDFLQSGVPDKAPAHLDMLMQAVRRDCLRPGQSLPQRSDQGTVSLSVAQWPLLDYTAFLPSSGRAAPPPHAHQSGRPLTATPSASGAPSALPPSPRDPGLLLALLKNVNMHVKVKSWPLQLVLDASATESYQKLYSFLSTLTAAKVAAEETYVHALKVTRRMAPGALQPATLQGMRSLSAQLTALHSLFVGLVVREQFEGLQQGLKAPQSVESMAECHHAFLTTITKMCFLHYPRQEAEVKAGRFISRIIFHGLLQSAMLHALLAILSGGAVGAETERAENEIARAQQDLQSLRIETKAALVSLSTKKLETAPTNVKQFAAVLGFFAC